jgi:hypothetical protein
MGDLEDAYASSRKQPFPPGSNHDAPNELHADLALADAWVADSVIPFVERGLKHPAQVDVIEELRKLRTRAAELGHAGNREDTRLADSYREYAELLLRVYEAFLTQPRPEP